MAIQQHFIGWDRPITETVRRFLFPEAITESADLGDTLIVVPTRQASRRLRESLAAHCADSDAALLSAEVVLPAAFFRSPPHADQRLSSPLLTQAVWTEMLNASTPTDFTTLFPAIETNRDLAWAERTGKTLQELRVTLADGGYTIQSVVEKHADALEEYERWTELAEAEERYLNRITELGYRDGTYSKIERANNPELEAGIKRIVIASVPDPSLLMIRALTALESSVTIDILIAAPKAHKDLFDAWGRPEQAPWKTRSIDIPHAEQTILLAGTPKSQAAHTLRVITGASQQFGPADIAIGVPDRAVIPLLSAKLAENDLHAFDPTEKTLSAHPIFGVLDACLSLYTTRSYTDLRNLLRHPDMLSYLKSQGIALDTLLSDLDTFQGRHLPLRLDDVLTQLTPDTESSPYPGLLPAITATCDLINCFNTMPPAEAAQTLLQTLYKKRMISSKDPDDNAFSAAAEKIAEVIRELSETQTLIAEIDSKTALRLLMQRLSEQTYHADREDASVDLEGWLELPWNDAPFMIATGMNEGRVPDGRLSDIFLPNSLRQHLGLRNDAGRLARDAYLMTLMIESRRQSGKTVFIVGKTSNAGDPLKPSRLLFRCPQPELAERAKALFAPVEEHDPHHASTVSFKLSPLAPLGNRPLTEAISKLSVTSFRAYLACPFRFYLNNILYMRSLDDSKREMDALDFGVIVHSALQRMGESEMWKASDEKQLADFLIAEAEATLKTRFPTPAPLPVRLCIEAARQRLRQAAAVQIALVREGWDLIQTESTYEMVIDGLPIRGTIDRVDKHRETGAFRIIDYKTSDREANPISVHLSSVRDDTPQFAQVDVGGKAKRWTDLQLPLYHRLLQTNGILSEDAEMAYFNLPKAVMQTGVANWGGWSPLLGDSAYTCAEAIVSKIHQGRFWPPATRVDYDDFKTLFPGTPENCFEALDSDTQRSEDQKRSEP